MDKKDRENINKIVKMFNAQWVKVDGQKYMCKPKVAKTEAEMVKDTGRY